MNSGNNGYEYDVFLSYPRHEPALGWVHLHFFPRLQEWLTECLGRPAAIFVDTKDLETGTTWPLQIKQALLRSRILVPVLSAVYFRRPWCQAEWNSMRRRETMLGMRTPQRPSGLIFPVIFFDGESFPEDAKSIQLADFRRWNLNVPGFRNTDSYVEFVQEVQRFAQGVHRTFDDVPVWEDGWPVVEPPAVPDPTMKLPRL